MAESNNCSSCKKFSKKPLQMVIVNVKNSAMIKFGFMCEKCIRKEQEKIGATACSIEFNRDGKQIYRCPHCKMETIEKEYFIKHNCVNFLMTKEFADSLKEDKK